MFLQSSREQNEKTGKRPVLNLLVSPSTPETDTHNGQKSTADQEEGIPFRSNAARRRKLPDAHGVDCAKGRILSQIEFQPRSRRGRRDSEGVLKPVSERQVYPIHQGNATETELHLIRNP